MQPHSDTVARHALPKPHLYDNFEKTAPANPLNSTAKAPLAESVMVALLLTVFLNRGQDPSRIPASEFSRISRFERTFGSSQWNTWATSLGNIPRFSPSFFASLFRALEGSLKNDTNTDSLHHQMSLPLRDIGSFLVWWKQSDPVAVTTFISRTTVAPESYAILEKAEKAGKTKSSGLSSNKNGSSGSPTATHSIPIMSSYHRLPIRHDNTHPSTAYEDGTTPYSGLPSGAFTPPVPRPHSTRLGQHSSHFPSLSVPTHSISQLTSTHVQQNLPPNPSAFQTRSQIDSSSSRETRVPSSHRAENQLERDLFLSRAQRCSSSSSLLRGLGRGLTEEELEAAEARSRALPLSGGISTTVPSSTVLATTQMKRPRAASLSTTTSSSSSSSLDAIFGDTISGTISPSLHTRHSDSVGYAMEHAAALLESMEDPRRVTVFGFQAGEELSVEAALAGLGIYAIAMDPGPGAGGWLVVTLKSPSSALRLLSLSGKIHVGHSILGVQPFSRKHLPTSASAWGHQSRSTAELGPEFSSGFGSTHSLLSPFRPFGTSSGGVGTTSKLDGTAASNDPRVITSVGGRAQATPIPTPIPGLGLGLGLGLELGRGLSSRSAERSSLAPFLSDAEGRGVGGNRGSMGRYRWEIAHASVGAGCWKEELDNASVPGPGAHQLPGFLAYNSYFTSSAMSTLEAEVAAQRKRAARQRQRLRDGRGLLFDEKSSSSKLGSNNSNFDSLGREGFEYGQKVRIIGNKVPVRGLAKYDMEEDDSNEDTFYGSTEKLTCFQKLIQYMIQL